MAERPALVLVVGPTTGGIGRHARSIAEHMCRRGLDVTVVVPAATDAVLDWGGTGALLHPAPVGAARPGAVMATLRAVREVTSRPVVVHAHGARAGALASAARRHPLVVTWHNTSPARWRRRWSHPIVERTAARGADVTLAVSPDLAHRARRAGARDVRSVAVPAPAPAPASRSREEVRAALGLGDRQLVLAVARLEPQKRLDLLVAATAGWATRTGAPVVAVAGTGSLAARLQRQAAQLRSPLVLLGPRDDIPDLLAAADVAVLPSDWEGYPLVAQEALAAGTPLVATAVGGLPGLVGDAAVLVPPGEPAYLRDALDRLLSSAELRRHLTEAGRLRAKGWPTTDEVMEDLFGLYLELSSGAR